MSKMSTARKGQRSNFFYCSEPCCMEHRRSLANLKIHMRNAHKKKLDLSTSFECSCCQQTFEFHQDLSSHFKTLGHVACLVADEKIPKDTWKLISKDIKELDGIDATDFNTTIKSLTELADILRDIKPDTIRIHPPTPVYRDSRRMPAVDYIEPKPEPMCIDSTPIHNAPKSKKTSSKSIQTPDFIDPQPTPNGDVPAQNIDFNEEIEASVRIDEDPTPNMVIQPFTNKIMRCRIVAPNVFYEMPEPKRIAAKSKIGCTKKTPTPDSIDQPVDVSPQPTPIHNAPKSNRNRSKRIQTPDPQPTPDDNIPVQNLDFNEEIEAPVRIDEDPTPNMVIQPFTTKIMRCRIVAPNVIYKKPEPKRIAAKSKIGCTKKTPTPDSIDQQPTPVDVTPQPTPIHNAPEPTPTPVDDVPEPEEQLPTPDQDSVPDRPTSYFANKEKRYKSLVCPEPNCDKHCRTMPSLEKHMSRKHKKTLNPSLVRIVYPKLKHVTEFTCFVCPITCRTQQYLNFHFKGLSHIKRLVDAHMVPEDTHDLVSKNKQRLREIDVTNPKTATESLIQLAEKLRGGNPAPVFTPPPDLTIEPVINEPSTAHIEKGKCYKQYFCSEPDCLEIRFGINLLKRHIRRAHGKKMDRSLIKCVFPEVRNPTPHICTNCAKAFETRPLLKAHLKSLRHITRLIELNEVPEDTHDLFSRYRDELEEVDTTTGETVIESLRELVPTLREYVAANLH